LISGSKFVKVRAEGGCLTGENDAKEPIQGDALAGDARYERVQQNGLRSRQTAPVVADRISRYRYRQAADPVRARQSDCFR